MKIKILYYGGVWTANIGNAFIDYGSLHTIKTAVPEATIYFASEEPKYFHGDKAISLATLMQIDWVVVSGMTLCNEFIKNEGPVLKILNKRGVKIIFNGCGGDNYTEDEIKNFNLFLKSLKIDGFISRDQISYENYKHHSSLSYNGIDCAFFLQDAFKPSEFISRDFVVYNFDRMEEPNLKNPNKRIIRTFHSNYRGIKNATQKPGITLTLKSTFPFLSLKVNKQDGYYLNHKNILISDLPEDYLNLYSNTYATFSDRVHACIATLSFNNYARIFLKNPRVHLFDRVGASDIRQKLVKLNQIQLKKEMENQLKFLREIFTGA